MKLGRKSLRRLFLGVVALLTMVMALPGCDTQGVTPGEEETAGAGAPAEDEQVGVAAPSEEGAAGGAMSSEDQTITLYMTHVGIEGEVAGSVSFLMPEGYQLYRTEEHQSTWGEEIARWNDYDYHGTRVVQTVTLPDGSRYEHTGEEIDAISFGGGVVYIREHAAILAEAENSDKPHIRGTIEAEGSITVSGDSTSYHGYYYVSSRIEEETGEWEWMYGKYDLALRIALSETDPFYTLWLHFWASEPADFTNSEGDRYTFKLDGKPVMDTHREYLDDILSSLRITSWKAP